MVISNDFKKLQSQVRTIWTGGGAGHWGRTEEEQQSWKGARGSAQECQEEVEKGEGPLRVLDLGSDNTTGWIFASCLLFLQVSRECDHIVFGAGQNERRVQLQPFDLITLQVWNRFFLPVLREQIIFRQKSNNSQEQGHLSDSHYKHLF